MFDFITSILGSGGFDEMIVTAAAAAIVTIVAQGFRFLGIEIEERRRGRMKEGFEMALRAAYEELVEEGFVPSAGGFLTELVRRATGIARRRYGESAKALKLSTADIEESIAWRAKRDHPGMRAA